MCKLYLEFFIKIKFFIQDVTNVTEESRHRSQWSREISNKLSVTRRKTPPSPTTQVTVGGSGIRQDKIQYWLDTPSERGVWLNTIIAIYAAPGTDFNNSLESYVFSSLFVMLKICF